MITNYKHIIKWLVIYKVWNILNNGMEFKKWSNRCIIITEVYIKDDKIVRCCQHLQTHYPISENNWQKLMVSVVFQKKGFVHRGTPSNWELLRVAGIEQVIVLSLVKTSSSFAVKWVDKVSWKKNTSHFRKSCLTVDLILRKDRNKMIFSLRW